MSITWPTADLDGVQRLRALAAGVAGAAVTERVIPASTEDVWAVLTNFEGGFADVQPDMRGARLASHVGERVTVLARSHLGMRAELKGVVRPGYCWLQSRFLIVAMAAVAEPYGGTRVALTGGVRVPRRSAIVPVGVRRESIKSLDRLEGVLGVAGR